jgi:hypothetical protein
MTGGFQTSVNTVPAVGVAGDFASANVYYNYDAGPGGLVAGPAGVYVGRFAWTTAPVDGDGQYAVVNSFGSGSVAGFVPRLQQGLITGFLADASMLIPSGYQMGLMTGGDFWVVNSGTTQALPGQKAYATLASGLATFAATATPATATATAWGITAQTSTLTGTVAGNILTVSAVSGTYGIAIGALLTGGTGAASCYVVSQITPLLTGEALNGIGRYYVSVPEQVSGVTYTGISFGLLTLTTVTSGLFGLGSLLTGATAGVTAGTVITQTLTGTGGSTSTAIVNLTQSSGNSGQGNLTGTTNVETKWTAVSSALAGELVKISAQPLG